MAVVACITGQWASSFVVGLGFLVFFLSKLSHACAWYLGSTAFQCRVRLLGFMAHVKLL